jgi:flagellar biosynthesis protein FliQ
MNEIDALEIVQAALWTGLVASGPPIAASMVVGISISLLQALTQVQESTLSFVPKIVVTVFVASAAASFIGSVIFTFSEQIFRRIEAGGL